MKITLNRINDDYHFNMENGRGHSVQVDNTGAPNPQGASPMELLLMGIAGCSGIDIVSILKKQKLELSGFRMEVEGKRRDEVPKVFTGIHLKIHIQGDIPESKAHRAVELSLEKYCSVSKMLEKTAKISYEILLNGEAI
jgi:putative redox protein